MSKVLNKRTDHIPEGSVYVGRPSKWGNPFRIHRRRRGGEFANTIAIMAYKEYLEQHPEIVESARKELRGKDLVCWCAPLLCHADILLELANG